MDQKARVNPKALTNQLWGRHHQAVSDSAVTRDLDEILARFEIVSDSDSGSLSQSEAESGTISPIADEDIEMKTPQKGMFCDWLVLLSCIILLIPIFKFIQELCQADLPKSSHYIQLVLLVLLFNLARNQDLSLSVLLWSSKSEVSLILRAFFDGRPDFLRAGYKII